MKLKVCGMKYNAEAVASLEPDYMGFIFWEPSARYFNTSIADDLDPTIKKTGVFVDAPYETVVLSILEHNLAAVQLHGRESAQYCAHLKNLLREEASEFPQIIKAFAIHQDFDFDRLADYESVCDYFLFDTRAELPGGTGKKFNWRLLKNYSYSKPYFLSGGIGPEDVDALKEFLGSEEAALCHVIDVNSRFEVEPGLKDIEKLRNFISEMKIFKKEERL